MFSGFWVLGMAISLYFSIFSRHRAGIKLTNGSFRNHLNLLKESLLSTKEIRSMRTKPVVPAKKMNSELSNIGLTFEVTKGGSQASMSALWKPFLFTITFSAGTLSICAIWQYENVRKAAKNRLEGLNFWHNLGSPLSKTTITKQFEWREKINQFWNNLTEGEKLFYTICLANVLVHLMWKVPMFETTMIRYFSSNPNSSATCWPLLLATFSHYSTIHIAMNMYALHSFSSLAINSLGKEQFLGVYLVGGVISSFTSLFFRVLRQKKDLSVGASGAILATIGYICAKYPDLEISIIGLPAYKFMAENAITALILFDLVGLVFGFKFFDHAAHLGGTFFGIFWYHWGNANIWEKREPLLHWWHELRNSAK